MTRRGFLAATGQSASAPVTEPCSMCGEPHWDAYWMGAQCIFLCRDCATANLAGLYLDSVWCPGWKDVADAERALETFQTRFYRCVALAFAHRARVAK